MTYYRATFTPDDPAGDAGLIGHAGRLYSHIGSNSFRDAANACARDASEQATRWAMFPAEHWRVDPYLRAAATLRSMALDPEGYRYLTATVCVTGTDDDGNAETFGEYTIREHCEDCGAHGSCHPGCTSAALSR